MQEMTRWPSPALKIEESRRSDDGVIADPYRGKRDPRARLKPLQSRIDVADRFILALRHRTPLIETRGVVRRSIDGRSIYQPVNMAMLKGFEPNMPAREYEGFCSHDFSMQRVASTRNAVSLTDSV